MELEGLFKETEAKNKCLVSTANLGLIYDYKSGCVKNEDSTYLYLTVHKYKYE